MTQAFEPRVLGKTNFEVGPLGLAAGYGVGANATEEAFERGVRYFYWAWQRKSGMRDGLRNVFKNNREKAFLSITSLAPTGPMIRWSVERVLKALGTDYIDCLQFYLFKGRPPFSMFQLEPALKLKEKGLIRHIGFSAHHRPSVPKFAKENFADISHIRYNAIHRGAEEEIFPKLPPKGDSQRPGIVAFTVTSWGQLINAAPSKLGDLQVPTAGDCYRFALTSPGIDVCLTGPANDDQMRHALDAVEKGPMTEEELLWMRNVGDRLSSK